MIANQKSISLTDASGRKVYSIVSKETFFNINTSTFAKGVYFLNISSEQDTKIYKIEF